MVGCHGRSKAGGLKCLLLGIWMHLAHLIRGSSGSSGSAGTLRIFMIPNLAALTAPPVMIARWCGPAASLRAAWNLSLFHLGCCAAVASTRVDVAKC